MSITLNELPYPVRMAILGRKAALRRVRAARTRHYKFLSQVGSRWRLIDSEWLSSRAKAVIARQDADEARLLEEIKQLKEDGRGALEKNA